MKTKRKICVVSTFIQTDGYGKHALQLALALKREGFEVYIYGVYISDGMLRPIDYDLKVANPNGDYFDAVLVYSPPQETQCATLRETIKAKKYVLYTMWEALEIPRHWPTVADCYFDRTLLTSSYTYLQWCSVKPINNASVCMPGIYVDQISREKPKSTGPIEFFLFANDGKYERKNYKQQIRCWFKVFGKSKKHHLTVKTTNRREDFMSLMESCKNITLVDRQYSAEELETQLVKTDVLLFVTLGEGFGMPPREAAMAECAVVIGDIGDGLAPLAACHDVFTVKPCGTQKKLYWSGSNIVPDHDFTWVKYDDDDICGVFKRIKTMSRDELHACGLRTKEHVRATEDIKLKINDLVRALC